ncbi:MAG: ACP S-malonyltransferase, partial [Acidobacteriota bacterium]
MSYAFLFPGQGSQQVGMGRDWCDLYPVARRTFEEADDVLGIGLKALCFEGPEADLQLTANTQPAILTASIAIYRSLLEHAPEIQPGSVAGHSLGEYSAHVAAGTLDFADALRLVRRRGLLMQEAVPVGVGAMAAVIGLDDEVLAQIVEEISRAEASEAGSAQRVSLANMNSPGQVVIAGHVGAVEKAAAAAKEAGARMAKMLPVSAPFHSPL